MSRIIHVHLLPDLIPANAVENQSAVILDILRASSTIVTAFENGVSAVIPCGEPADALRLKAISGGESLLGGERGGVRIAGFDFGNSPAEYTRSAIAGRRLAFTTTNGTRALLKCRQAAEIAIGCILNINALAAWLARSSREIHLVCAGTDGFISGEDVYAAGAIVEAIGRLQNSRLELNDSAELAHRAVLQLLEGTPAPAETLARAFEQTRGGRNLLQIGQQIDLTLCGT